MAHRDMAGIYPVRIPPDEWGVMDLLFYYSSYVILPLSIVLVIYGVIGYRKVKCFNNDAQT